MVMVNLLVFGPVVPWGFAHLYQVSERTFIELVRRLGGRTGITSAMVMVKLVIFGLGVPLVFAHLYQLGERTFVKLVGSFGGSSRSSTPTSPMTRFLLPQASIPR
jgi:hypothetical protein